MNSVEKWEDPEVKAYYRQIKKIPMLTKEQKLQLFEAYQKGDMEARNQLIQSDLRWVAYLAKRYFGSFGMDPMDIIQYANIGLMRAIEKYDPTRGAGFTFYAAYWIRITITRGIITDGRLIHVPDHQVALQKKLLKEIDTYYKEHGTYLQADELAERLGAKKRDVELSLQHLDLPRWLEGMTEVRQIQDLFDCEMLCDWTNFIVDSTENVENTVMKHRLEEELNPVLTQLLTPKEYDILSRYYGLQGNDGAVLGEVASVYGLSCERVRQILRYAEARLSRNYRLKPFQEYVREGTGKPIKVIPVKKVTYLSSSSKKMQKKK